MGILKLALVREFGSLSKLSELVGGICLLFLLSQRLLQLFDGFLVTRALGRAGLEGCELSSELLALCVGL